MGYFSVRYDSRVVIYEHKMFLRLATGQLLRQFTHDFLAGCLYTTSHLMDNAGGRILLGTYAMIGFRMAQNDYIFNG